MFCTDAELTRGCNFIWGPFIWRLNRQPVALNAAFGCKKEGKIPEPFIYRAKLEIMIKVGVTLFD